MVYEESHADDRERLVLLAVPVLSAAAFLLDLEVVVGTVVIKDIIPPFKDLLAVSVQF
jgi:hypothetical protein